MRFKLFSITLLLTLLASSLQAQEDESDCDGQYDCDDQYWYGGYDEYNVCWTNCARGRPDDCNPCSQRAFDLGLRGVWMPPDPLLFRHFVADPRQPTYSAALRFNDNALTKYVIPVSYYSNFPVYRWLDVWPCGGMLQLDLEGCLWAVFDPATFEAPLINADYYVAVPLSYCYRNWSFRLRGYHISSHIGDEYLLNHPDFDRRNPSAETIDFFVSNYITPDIRLYGGLGWVINQDKSFRTKRFLAECGLELRLYGLGFHNYRRDIFGHPFYGMHFRYKPHFRKHIDSTYVLGYEFGKCCGSQQRLRAFIEYHDGYSVEGQFSRKATTYFSLRVSYGY